jgi:hypothetical protein
MVEILCPHCEGEIELDDDASGEFECPLCNGEFEWNVEPTNEQLSISYQKGSIVNHPIQFFGLGFSVIMLVVLIMSLSATYYTFSFDEDDSFRVNFKLSEYEMEAGENSISFDYSESEDDNDNTWGVAGFVAKICFILALIICSLAIIARVLDALSNIEVVQLPEVAESIVNGTARFSSFVVALLILIGIILFMIISPSAATMEINTEGVSYGFTFFTWFMVVLPILYSVFSKLEVDFS